MNTEERPLLTFALIAYRQAPYIREAVRAALAQTYHPLEIILSDDCSPDDTFAQIKAEAEAYRGEHPVIVSQTPHNLGLSGHINHIMTIARGDLVVIAAGDDISFPHRVEAIWTAWDAAGRKATSLYSAIRLLDEHGHDLGPLESPLPQTGDLLSDCIHGLIVTGSAHAWHRRVFDEFGPLRADLKYEDRGIALRSNLLGGIQYIPEALVHYRRVLGSITFTKTPGDPAEARMAETAKHAESMLSVYRQWEDDFSKSERSPDGWRKMLAQLRAQMEFVVAMVKRGFFGRFSAFVRALATGLPLRATLKTYAMFCSHFVFRIWARRNPRLRESGWEGEMSRRRTASRNPGARERLTP
jgi:glycosyltransferase involved in cell wall biosynthesis